MNYVNFITPPYPHFICAGDALYRPGDAHRRRANIGIFDMIYIEYGELFLTDNHKAYHLKANDVLLIRPDQEHFGHKQSTVKSKFKWLHFRSAGKMYFSDDVCPMQPERQSMYSFEDRKNQLILPLYKKLSPLESSEFSSYFSKLVSFNVNRYQQREDQGQTLLSPLECQELFLRLMNILQIFQPQLNSSQLLATNIMEYLAQNYHRQITLEDIAQYFNFHPAHIIRCLKKEFGITPNKALNGIRIENAKKMLVTSDLSINKISFCMGFSTPTYFNRVFKEYTGQTPKEYRAEKLHQIDDIKSNI